MSGEVSRAVVLTLKIVADPGNAKAAAAVDRLVDDSAKKQIASGRKVSDAAAKEAKKVTDNAAKEYDQQANDALKAYSRIMKERDKQAAAETKANEKATRDAQKAYDQQTKEAVRAYSRITKEQERNEASLDRLTDRAENYGKRSAKAGVQAAGSVIQLGQGFATLGVLSEETTDGMLKGLIKVQGGFQILSGIVSGYDDITDSIEFVTKATKAQAAAQELVNSATARGVATKIAAGAAGSAVASGVGAATGQAAGSAAGAAAGTAIAGGTATAVFVALKTGITAAAGAVGGFLASFGPFAAMATAGGIALNELVSYLGRLAGFDWESPTNALREWLTASSKSADSTKALTAAEHKREQAKAQMERDNAAAAAKDAIVRQGVGMRETLTGFQASASGQNESGQAAQQRAAAQAEIQAERLRLQQAQAARAQNIGQGGLGATGAVEGSQQRLAEQSQKLVQIDQQRYQQAKAIQDSQRQTVQSMREQYQEARKLVDSEKQRYQSTLARIGALSAGEQNQAAKIAEAIKAGEALTQAQMKFAEERNLFSAQIEKQRAAAGSTEQGRMIADVETGGQAAIKEAEFKAAQAKEALIEADEELDRTTQEVNTTLADFRESLAALPKAFQAILDLAAQKAGQSPESATSAGGAAAVGQAGQNVAAAQQELQDAMVAALDSIEEKTRVAIDAINSRNARGSTIQSAIS